MSTWEELKADIKKVILNHTGMDIIITNFELKDINSVMGPEVHIQLSGPIKYRNSK